MKKEQTMSETVANVFKYVFMIIGGLLFIMAVLSNSSSNLHLGIILTYVAGALTLLLGAYFQQIVSHVHWSILAVVGVIVLAVIVFISGLYVLGAKPTANYKEDAVIVLGASIRKEEIGANLKSRLDTAYEYHKQNPNALIFLSGGKGASEDISEAEAMFKYLLKKGVPEDKMVLEDKSTTTEENFLFTKKLLDANFEGEYTLTFITNDFHITRAHKYAERAGITSLNHLGSPTTWYMVVPNGLREFLAVMELWLLK